MSLALKCQHQYFSAVLKCPSPIIVATPVKLVKRKHNKTNKQKVYKSHAVCSNWNIKHKIYGEIKI